MTKATPRLQKPVLLQILALLFILAPFGNILISFYGTGHPEWYNPQIFLGWLASIQALDWFWLGITFLTGVLLFIQHKTAWLIAIINLMLILVVNLYRWATTGDLIAVEYSYFQTQILISILASLMALGIIFYSRYPYLDRRTPWLGAAAPRFDIQSSVEVVAQDVFKGETVNLSMSGVLIKMQKPLGTAAQMRYVDLIFKEVQNLKITSEIVNYHEGLLRLRFRDLNREARTQLKNWIKSKA